MNLTEVKYVQLGSDLRVPIKLTNRAMIEYESLTGESRIRFTGGERLSKAFFCTAKAGARALKQEFPYDYEAFLDLIDDYYFDVMNGFTDAMLEIMGIDKETAEKSTEAGEEKKNNLTP